MEIQYFKNVAYAKRNLKMDNKAKTASELLLELSNYKTKEELFVYFTSIISLEPEFELAEISTKIRADGKEIIELRIPAKYCMVPAVRHHVFTMGPSIVELVVNCYGSDC